VVDDLAHYVEFNDVRFFRFVDESIVPASMQLVSQEILARKLQLFFEMYCRIDPVAFSQEYCALLASAGCRQIFFGLESVGPITRQLINKGNLNTRSLKDTLAATKSAGIMNYVFVMVGIPNAPEEEEDLTMRFLIKNLDVHVATVGSFLVDMHSPIDVANNIFNKYDIELARIGDMTTEIEHLVHGKNQKEHVTERCATHLRLLYGERPDLALTSVLSDELRLILTAHFGNSFAQEAVRNPKIDLAYIKNIALGKTLRERIARELD
jgi:hypothetical protein